MSLAKALNGLEPARIQGGAPNSSAGNRYPITNGYDNPIFMGDPVILLSSTGALVPASVNTDKCLGVFMGCYFNNPLNKNQPTWSPYWTGDTSTTDGSQPYGLVLDNPMATFFIQADASVSMGDIGWHFEVTAVSGSTLTGRSKYGLDAGTRTQASKLLQIVDIKQDPDNAWGDPYPVVEVRIVQNRNAYTSGG